MRKSVIAVLITLEESLTFEKLTEVMSNRMDHWEAIGFWLNIRDSECENIREQYSGNIYQCSHACWKLYTSAHPAPTWKQVAYALYLGNFFRELEVVKKVYLIGKNSNCNSLKIANNIMEGEKVCHGIVLQPFTRFMTFVMIFTYFNVSHLAIIYSSAKLRDFYNMAISYVSTTFVTNPITIIIYCIVGKYWRKLNLAVGPQITIANILANLNLVIW